MNAARLAMLLLVTGCISNYTPPTPAPARPMVFVRAPFDATWTAVVDLFADDNIPIALINRSSGLVVGQMLRVRPRDGVRWGSCGTIIDAGRVDTIPPTSAEYNIRVRALADTASTVRVTARWTAFDPGTPITTPRLDVCETTHRWEGQIEARIREAAERRH